MRRLSLVLLLLWPAGMTRAGPIGEVEAALTDLERLPSAVRHRQRYLSCYGSEEKDQKLWGAVGDYWVNSLSSRGELERLTRVSSTLYRLDVGYYGKTFEKTWENLSNSEPYFYQGAKAELLFRKGPDGKRRWVKVEPKEERALGAWLKTPAAAKLALLTRSRSPIVSLDWFLHETSQQVDRNETKTGYYDFLGVKNRDDFFKLVEFNQGTSERLEKEIRAAVAESGVALNNRGIVRFQSVTGEIWITLDTKNSKGKRNAIQNLNGDLQHDAEEIYQRKANGLYNYFAGDANGVKQDAVPDFIASDGTAPGNDRRIHFRSCVRCHVEGIRPIDDYVRAVEQAPLKLEVKNDLELFLKRRRTYLSNLELQVKKDQNSYAEVVYGLTRLKVPELARDFARLAKSYEMGSYDIKAIARRTGHTEQRIRVVLTSIDRLVPPLDRTFKALIANKPRPIRREMLEDNFANLMTLLDGYYPKEE
jgi:hypothetical protein